MLGVLFEIPFSNPTTRGACYLATQRTVTTCSWTGKWDEAISYRVVERRRGEGCVGDGPTIPSTETIASDGRQVPGTLRVLAPEKEP